MTVEEKLLNLLKELHPTKNQNLAHLKKNLPKNYNDKVWWVCEKNHEWEATIKVRYYKNTGCPVCANRKIVPGVNDLKTINPELAAQWHPTKNGILRPEQVTVRSGKKIWWQCNNNHEWETTVANRKNTNCPYCSGNKPLPGFNDLGTLAPELARELHPKFNSTLTATQITAKTSKPVWWLGECGHEWKTSPYNRYVGKTQCPYCTGNKILSGFNDLSTTHPDIAAQWHPTKNSSLNLENIIAGSDVKVWWVCEKGHEWSSYVYHRSAGQNCPVCLNRLFIPEINSLKVKYPELAAQWHPTKNGTLTTNEIFSGSNQKVWWLDRNCGHEWEANLNNRVHGKTGCPYCKKSQPEKDLASFFTTLNINFAQNSKKIITPLELDFYFPELNIAIEFNGLYWHSEEYKPRNYHYDKWLACKEKGIQLIQIWEDDWNRNPKLVKSMLAHKLGVSTQRKIGARETYIQEISPQTSQQFLNKYHIQGKVKGTVHLGAFIKKNNTLVAVMVFEKQPKQDYDYLLSRYATSCLVIGGFTKMIQYFIQNYKPKKIITFSDNTISSGELYKNHSFMIEKHIRPDYMYVVNGVRKHKFGYRLKTFQNNTNLQYQEELTEKQLAKINNLVRIWDAGKIRWVLNLSKEK